MVSLPKIHLMTTLKEHNLGMNIRKEFGFLVTKGIGIKKNLLSNLLNYVALF